MQEINTERIYAILVWRGAHSKCELCASIWATHAAVLRAASCTLPRIISDSARNASELEYAGWPSPYAFFTNSTALSCISSARSWFWSSRSSKHAAMLCIVWDTIPGLGKTNIRTTRRSVGSVGEPPFRCDQRLRATTTGKLATRRSLSNAKVWYWRVTAEGPLAPLSRGTHARSQHPARRDTIGHRTRGPVSGKKPIPVLWNVPPCTERWNGVGEAIGSSTVGCQILRFAGERHKLCYRGKWSHKGVKARVISQRGGL